jgi:hypothetical protein
VVLILLQEGFGMHYWQTVYKPIGSPLITNSKETLRTCHQRRFTGRIRPACLAKLRELLIA